MNAPPRPLRRLADTLGARPEPGRPRWSCVYLIVFGAALAALNAWPGTGWGFGNPYAPPLAVAAGLSLACSGAAGLLLRAGREGPSLWFSALQALLLFPMTAFGFLALSGWVGPLWAAGVSAVVLGTCWLLVARSRRPRRGP